MLGDAEATTLFETLERRYGIAIVAAWQSGSHAWGFADANSDLDLNFVYVQPPLSYAVDSQYTRAISASTRDLNRTENEHGLLVETLPDELEMYGNLDLTGHDVRYYLYLLSTASPPAVENLFADSAYVTADEMDDLRETVRESIDLASLHRNYLSWARGNYECFIDSGEAPTVKHTLHAVRELLYADHIESTESIPPMDFERFLNESPVVEGAWADREADIRNLLDAKREGRGAQAIDNLFAAEFHERIDAETPDDLGGEGFATEELDAHLQELVTQSPWTWQ